MSCYDKIYPVFNEGDEVYTNHKYYKAITSNKSYEVIKCYKPQGYVKDYPVIMIELMSDGGYISRYSTEKFKKTERQVRQDKLNDVLIYSK